MTYVKTKNIANDFTEMIINDIKLGKTVTIPKLGSFSISEHKSRQIKDINTGEYIIIPARRKVKYKPNKWIITQINE